jgi:ribosomal protein S18 acetylase RimI-like enzyme
MQIIKPDLSEIPNLLSLWKEQYELHNNLDDTYYVPYSEELSQQFSLFLEKAVREVDPNILVAKENDTLLGFITFEEDSEEYFDTKIKKFGTVVELFVSETARNKGVGRALMNAAETFFISKGLRNIKVASSTFNTRALKFYDSLGYTNRQTLLFKEIV